MNESTLPQVRDLFKQIMAEPERMFELVHMNLKEQCERVVNELLKAELTTFLDRKPYERQAPTEVSRVTAEPPGAIEQWRMRDLSSFDVKYVIIDGVQFPMRTGHSIERVPMLVVLGVLRGTNRKVFLTIQQGTKDSRAKDRRFQGQAGQPAQVVVPPARMAAARFFRPEWYPDTPLKIGPGVKPRSSTKVGNMVTLDRQLLPLRRTAVRWSAPWQGRSLSPEKPTR